MDTGRSDRDAGAGAATTIRTAKDEVIEIVGFSFPVIATKSTRLKTGAKGFPGLNWGMLRAPAQRDGGPALVPEPVELLGKGSEPEGWGVPPWGVV